MVAKDGFVHLHLHTQYSLLDGAIQHNPLFEQVKALGMQSVAMTDHGNLFGAAEFYDGACTAGVKPIIGCEVYLASGSRFDKEKRATDKSGFDAINHLLLLAMNETGYKNLIYLVSKGYLEGFYYKPRIDLELLRAHSDGLITTSGCLSSMMSRAILGGETTRAWELAQEFSRIFPDRFYLEVQRHGLSMQDHVNAELLKMHEDLRLPLVATNDAHYLHDHDHDAHDALLCIGTGANLADEKRFRFDGRGFFVKSPAQMLETFADLPQAVANSVEIAERCHFEMEMGKYHMPEFQVPLGKTREGVLREQSWAGLRTRLGLAPDEPFAKSHENYVARMEHELNVICSTGFAGYFLVVADFIQFAKQNGVPVGPGRGSAAGSLATYSLGITGVDPIEYDIIFERFLNPERVSLPDIDVDFCMRGRDRVIKYVSEKYDGEGVDQKRVAQIITFGKLQARAAIRDVGRVTGMPYGDVDRISKMVPEELGISLAEAIEKSPELRVRAEVDGQVAKLLETAQAIEGLTRHASTHAAGVVIGTKPLIEMVPLYRDPKSSDIIIQFDMKMVEKVGLVKFDFLGLKTLTIIADAERLIRETKDPEFSIEKISLDEPKTYELLCRGNTEGVFQMESSGMTELVTKLKPRKFKEIIPIIALYRPGPLESGMVEDYIRRKQGLTKVEYLLPEIEAITAETLGIIVYQDQVLQIANRVSGYSLGEADLLRRAMGKKKPEEMEKQRTRFIDGAKANSIDAKKASDLFDLIEKFAGYGFAKSHSTAYALITYQTAFLKANYPREYMAALLTIESGNHDRLARYIAHAHAMEIEVLAPDINTSERNFAVVGDAIRFGFTGIKNVGEGAIEAILAARAEGGAFKSIFDFAGRVDGRKANRRVVESIVRCGAFDSLHENRAAVFAALDHALESGSSAQRDREVGQSSLFGASAATEVIAEPALLDVPPWTDAERLAHEKEVLGFYVSGHPLKSFAPLLERFAVPIPTVREGREQQEVRVGGLIKALREHHSRKGPMAFATIEDLEGAIELVIFSDSWGLLSSLFRRASGQNLNDGVLPLLVTGKLDLHDPESPKILVSEAIELGLAESRLSKSLHIRVSAEDLTQTKMLALHNLLRATKGDCGVTLHIVIPSETETILALPPALRVQPSENLLHEVDSLFGKSVTELSQ